MKVAIFRPQEYIRQTEEKLRRAGFDVISAPLIELKEENVDVRGCDYTIVTSQTAARIALKRGLIRGKVIAIGTKTAEVLSCYETLTPSRFDSETLFNEFRDLLRGKKVNLLRSDKGSEILRKLSNFCDLKEYKLYRIRILRNERSREIVKDVAMGWVDAAIFSSRLIVESFMVNSKDACVFDDVLKSLNSIKSIAIGPPTKRKLEEYGVKALMPERYDFDGVIELLTKMKEISER